MMLSNRMNRVFKSANTPLQHADPVVYKLYRTERKRQQDSLELIASENFTSRGVLEALGTEFTNKYSEGYPGRRYYGGNRVVDELETLCQERALEAFRLDPSQWGCNVQPYSGSPANFAVYTGLLKPNDRIMGLDLPSGGHLTHGHKASASSTYFRSMPYGLNEETGYIDYDRLEDRAIEFRPKLLVCGGSAYPREYDYERFRRIADQAGAYLMCDIAHISGLVAADETEQNPFDHADVVTSTTHKSLRGPRSGIVFFRKEHERAINTGVFPALQGGPHNHQIAALCVSLKQSMDPTFKTYIRQVKANARALARYLMYEHGYKLITSGTDNHLILWDLRPLGVTGDRFERMCELCDITVNKNTVVGDRNPLKPGGVRIGTPAMTSRGFTESEFERVGQLLHEVVLQCAIPDETRIEEIRRSVHELTGSFPMPGFGADAR